MNVQAINGEHNTGRPVAIAALFILGAALSIFWYQFPLQISFRNNHQKAIQFSGISAMVTAMFLFTNYHDAAINVAGVPGLVALTGTFVGLYKNKWYKLAVLGILNLLLLSINSYVYYTTVFLVYLPVIQKITFLLFLFWIGAINIVLYQNAKFIISKKCE